MKSNMIRVGFYVQLIMLAVFVSGCNKNRLAEKIVELNQPFTEWELKWQEVDGNPYDVIAHAVFTHPDGEKLRSLMFYDGSNTWKFRFTGVKAGTWRIQTIGPGALGGLKGTVVVQDSGKDLPGFMVAEGKKWVWSGSRKEIVPQFVMAGKPKSYWSNDCVDDAKIAETLQEFIVESGFNGLQISGVAGSWFDIDAPEKTVGNGNEPIGPKNPDQRTFKVLEELLMQSYAHGASVHIWIWASDAYRAGWNSRSGPDGIGGPMSDTDQRLNRYIAARLGPIPGWSLGYGWDLHAWATADELQTWYDFIKEHLGGWPHIIGARADKYDCDNQGLLQSDSLGLPRAPLSEVYWMGDYVGHYDYRVGYKWYVDVFDFIDKPQFQEDRFRIRQHQVFENKDYTPELIVRGLWHSTMAGGVANIFANLLPNNTNDMSHPFDNQAKGVIKGVSFQVDIKDAIKTYDEFWFGRNRFNFDLIRDNDLTGNIIGDGHIYPNSDDGINVCLRNNEKDFFVFYIENADTMRMDLRSMKGKNKAYAIDTMKEYHEITLDILDAKLYPTYQLPYVSNWAVVVGAN